MQTNCGQLDGSKKVDSSGLLVAKQLFFLQSGYSDTSHLGSHNQHSTKKHELNSSKETAIAKDTLGIFLSGEEQPARRISRLAEYIVVDVNFADICIVQYLGLFQYSANCQCISWRSRCSANYHEKGQYVGRLIIFLS